MSRKDNLGENQPSTLPSAMSLAWPGLGLSALAAERAAAGMPGVGKSADMSISGTVKLLKQWKGGTHDALDDVGDADFSFLESADSGAPTPTFSAGPSMSERVDEMVKRHQGMLLLWDGFLGNAVADVEPDPARD
eukprot:gene10793-12767_t